jgi:hypothetical protein
MKKVGSRVCMVGGAVHKHYLNTKGTLPALLRVLAYTKTQFTPMIPYLRWYRSCTMIDCAANFDISSAVYLDEIVLVFFIWQIASSYVGSGFKANCVKGLRQL